MKINLKYKDSIFISLMLFLLIALIVIYFGMKSDGVQCLQNPFTYQTEKLAKANDADITCQCTAIKVGSPTLRWSNKEYDDPFESGSFPNFSNISFEILE